MVYPQCICVNQGQKYELYNNTENEQCFRIVIYDETNKEIENVGPHCLERYTGSPLDITDPRYGSSPSIYVRFNDIPVNGKRDFVQWKLHAGRNLLSEIINNIKKSYPEKEWVLKRFP